MREMGAEQRISTFSEAWTNKAQRKWEHLVSVVEHLQVLSDVKSIRMSLNFISSEWQSIVEEWKSS